MPQRSGSSGRHHLALDRSGRLVYASTILLMACGVLAFGSPYPWAYTPLAIGAALLGAAAFLASRPTRLLSDQRRVLLALGLLAFAAGLQFVPLPPGVVDALSPANAVVLRQIDLVFASLSAGLAAGDTMALPWRPLSIAPQATLRSLLLLLSFGLLLAGLLRHCNRFGVRRLAWWFVVFGTLVALIGIVQKSLLGDSVWGGMKIYGLWTPRARMSTPFGPFVNRNHFAGWMLMALPVALGYVLAAAEIGLRNVRPGWRHRLLWLSSPEGGRLQIAIFAVVLMSVSLLMTQSRSGVACFGMAMAIATIAAARHQRSVRGRLGVVVAIGILAAAPVLWAKSDVLGRFSVGDDHSLALRRTIWGDTRRVISDFPGAGVGLNAFAAAMEAYQTGFTDQSVHEAHNDYLQLAAEGGMLLGVPFVLTVGVFVVAIRRRFASQQDDPTTAWMRFGAATGLAAIALQSLVEFSLQMPGNAVTFVVLAAIALHRPLSGRASSASVRSVDSASSLRHTN
jgi:O-Antigen ligase